MGPRKATIGERLADQIANLVGSWGFVATQLTIIVVWAGINVFPKNKLDPYPFQFLNLFLGVQSALTGPMLLIAGKRQEKLDRQRAIENLALDRLSYEDLKQISEKIESQFQHLDKDLAILSKEVEFNH